MTCRRGLAWLLILGACAGCQGPPKPIFAQLNAPPVWPAPPDRPRIRYLGALYGEESLGAQPSGWDAVTALLAGPPAKIGFSRPAAVAVQDELVFVADTGLGIVHRLDLEQRKYAALRGNEADALRVPIDVAIVDSRTLLVVDRGRAAVDVLSLDGAWQATHRWPELTAPVGVAIDPETGRRWLLDARAHALYEWQRDDALVHVAGQRGGGPGEFNFPSALTFDPAVGIVIADAMNFRVQVLDAAGQPVAVFGSKGDAAGDFSRPRDVAVDAEGHIYVVDNQFENIQIFDRDGQLLLAFGGGGEGPGEFSLPAGITIDNGDRIWVADSYNRRVQVFQYLPEQTSWDN